MTIIDTRSLFETFGDLEDRLNVVEMALGDFVQGTIDAPEYARAVTAALAAAARLRDATYDIGISIGRFSNTAWALKQVAPPVDVRPENWDNLDY